MGSRHVAEALNPCHLRSHKTKAQQHLLRDFPVAVVLRTNSIAGVDRPGWAVGKPFLLPSGPLRAPGVRESHLTSPKPHLSGSGMGRSKHGQSSPRLMGAPGGPGGARLRDDEVTLPPPPSLQPP